MVSPIDNPLAFLACLLHALFGEVYFWLKDYSELSLFSLQGFPTQRPFCTRAGEGCSQGWMLYGPRGGLGHGCVDL